MSNSKDQFKRNLRALGFAQALNFMYPLFVFPLIGKSVGPSVFGMLMFYYVLAATLSTVIDFGFSFEGPRQVHLRGQKEKDISRLYVAITASKFLVFLFVSLCLLLANNIFEKNLGGEYTYFPHFVVFPMLFGAAINPQWLLSTMSKLHFFTYASVFSRLAFFSYYLLADSASIGLVALTVSAPFLLTSALASLIAPCGALFDKESYSGVEIRRVMKESAPALITNLLTLPYTQGGALLLNGMQGPSAAAFFSAAERFVRPVIAINGVVFQAVYPLVCGGKNEKASSRTALYLALWPSLLAACMLLFFSRQIISLFYSSEFQSAAIVLEILAFLLVVNPLAMYFSHLKLLASGQGKLASKVYGAGSILYCVCAPFLINHYSEVGAAIALVTVEFSTAIAFVLLNKRN